MVDQINPKTSQNPPSLGPPPPNTHQNTEIHISIPQLGGDPPQPICSYNRCEGCKALFPIAGLALVNCPGCNQPTLLVKLSSCPKCNEPVKTIRLRVDHVSDKMPQGAHCKGQAGPGDVFLVDIEKPVWREDDSRIKDTTTNPKQGNEYAVKETSTKNTETVEKPERNSKSNDCGCKKAKTS